MRLLAILLAIIVSGASGCAPEPPAQQNEPEDTGEVLIEGVSKKTVGVLSGLQSGDVACYAELIDSSGQSFSEMALFEVCDQAHLIGKRVRMDYAMENVLADSCQGDPECTESKRVALIYDMRAADPDVLGEVPFVHEADFDLYGYFTPTQAIETAGMSFYGMYIPASAQETYDTGEGLRRAFILDFEAGGGYEKVFPTTYLVSSSVVEFSGTEAAIGQVSFEGVFDTEAMRAALDTGHHEGDTPLLTGTLTINGEVYAGLEFSWAGD